MSGIQEELDEIAAEGPYQQRYRVRRSRNTRRLVLYKLDRQNRSYRRYGKSFSYRALEGRLHRMGERALRDNEECDLFSALFDARIRFDPARGKRPRGVQAVAGRAPFLVMIRYVAPWAYVWAQNQGKRTPPCQRYRGIVGHLEQRGDWCSLNTTERTSLIAAALVLERYGTEWRKFGLLDPLTLAVERIGRDGEPLPDENLNRPETFYRRYIRPRLAEVRRVASPAMLAGRSAYLRDLLRKVTFSDP